MLSLFFLFLRGGKEKEVQSTEVEEKMMEMPE